MNNYVKRNLWFIAGIICNSFGIALIAKSALGTTPISSVPYVLSMYLPFTLGQLSFILNMIFILIQVILLKKDFSPLQYLQIAVNMLFSVGIDISMNILSAFSPSGILSAFSALLAGCTILAFGICVEIAPGVLTVPGEGVVRVISDVSKKKFGSVKICFDVSLILVALVLSLLIFKDIRGIGAGTVFAAVAVGKIVNVFNKRLPLIKYIEGLR